MVYETKIVASLKMKMLSHALLWVILNIASLEAYMVHQKAPIGPTWREEDLAPFDELMISWNAARPTEGRFLFYVSVKTDEWSSWLLYASWGNDGQSSFQSTAANMTSVRVYQDAVEVTEGKKATGFDIKIVAEGGANLDNIHSLHVYINSDRSNTPQKPDFCGPSICLNVPGLSQMTLDHIRHRDLCSPTSTTAVTRYLSRDATIDPLCFAQQAWDAGFDIFGNWVFNVAQASSHLGPEWNCWVERLDSFCDIYSYLEQKTPVVVSVRGPLPGSAQSYAKGHLLVVTGYDSTYQRVLCMDPAFPTDEATHVSYDLADFVQAWSRRGNVAYIFRHPASNNNL